MFSASQSFSQGETLTMGAAPQESAGKRQKQEEKLTCLPVTIRAIETAVEQSADNGGELRFYGTEQGMLVLVGAVEALTKQPASMEFSLNDATGRIKCRYYVTDGQPKELDEIALGRYVSVYGNVRTAPVLHFAVTGMRFVQSADEISYHMIESAHAALKLQGGTVTEPMTPSPKKPSLPMASDFSKSTQSELISPPTAVPEPPAMKACLDGAGLRSAILALLRQEAENKPEGVPLTSVLAHTKPTPEQETRKSLQQLVEDGDVFTTIDDEHFSCV